MNNKEWILKEYTLMQELSKIFDNFKSYNEILEFLNDEKNQEKFGDDIISLYKNLLSNQKKGEIKNEK